MDNNNPTQPAGELILYQTEDGTTDIFLRASEGTVWLTQAEIADLFNATPQNITQHIKSIYDDHELTLQATCKEYLQVRAEGTRKVERQLKHYNLEMIMAIGYRVRSPRGVQFRRWANSILQEYLIKGFVMDDDRLKRPDADYFDELLARIRDIRSSEQLFYKKILDIYATSVDYDPKSQKAQEFFQTVQNKMHYAAHGHTAAELIAERADATKDHMGLTSWTGQKKGALPRKADAAVAKNYLQPEELETLNRIVTAFLEFAELQAMNRNPMSMQSWVKKLNNFLTLSDQELLTHAGKVTAQRAKNLSQKEYDRWHERVNQLPSQAEKHFQEAISQTKALAATQLKNKKPSK